MQWRLSHISAGLAAVVVGYTSSVIIVIEAAKQLGADESIISSWLLVLGLGMGASCLGLSYYFKKPVLTAWSTPGAALLLAQGGSFSLAEATGAFIVASALMLLSGLFKPLSRLVEAIPSSLATAMLAGILVQFCIGAFEVLPVQPWWFALLFATYLLAKRWLSKFTMLAMLVVGLALSFFEGAIGTEQLRWQSAELVWTSPRWTWSAIISLALPLYLVTMVSQNLPGLAMLKAHHYQLPTRPLLTVTSVLGLLLAPFGGFAFNLAAITAALCMNQDVDSDAKQRYKASMWAGLFYILSGVGASVVVQFFLVLPSQLSLLLAGFALLGTLGMSLSKALEQATQREAALVCFLTTASGVSLFGIGAPLWGLMFGGLCLKLSPNRVNRGSRA